MDGLLYLLVIIVPFLAVFTIGAFICDFFE